MCLFEGGLVRGGAEADDDAAVVPLGHRALDHRGLRQHQRDRLLLGQAFLVLVGKRAEGRTGAIEQALPAGRARPGFERVAADARRLIIVEDITDTARIELIVSGVLASAAGALTSYLVTTAKFGKPDITMMCNGMLAGLVAITAPCYYVNSTGAVLIGLVGGVVVVFGIDLIEWLRIDDPIGAVAVHGITGIWGTWAVGIFATGQFGGVEGLWSGDGGKQLWAQVWSNALVAVVAFGAGYVVMAGVKKMGILRIAEEGELNGIDIVEHGSPAYHEEIQFMGKGQ